jgi:hypothetical protein
LLQDENFGLIDKAGVLLSFAQSFRLGILLKALDGVPVKKEDEIVRIPLGMKEAIGPFSGRSPHGLVFIEILFELRIILDLVMKNKDLGHRSPPSLKPAASVKLPALRI